MTDEPPRIPISGTHPASLSQDRPLTPQGTVQSLRPLPGQPSHEAYPIAMERLLAAMTMVCTINRTAAEAYRVAFNTAITAAPFGQHGAPVEKLLRELLKRLDQHLATLPNAPPPSAA